MQHLTAARNWVATPKAVNDVLAAVKDIGRGCCTSKSHHFASRNCIWYLLTAGVTSEIQQAHVNTSDYLHPANLEAQCCLSGASVFGFALVYVALVCSGVPCSEAQLDVYYAWVPISLCHIFQLQ